MPKKGSKAKDAKKAAKKAAKQQALQAEKARCTPPSNTLEQRRAPIGLLCIYIVYTPAGRRHRHRVGAGNGGQGGGTEATGGIRRLPPPSTPAQQEVATSMLGPAWNGRSPAARVSLFVVESKRTGTCSRWWIGVSPSMAEPPRGEPTVPCL